MNRDKNLSSGFLVLWHTQKYILGSLSIEAEFQLDLCLLLLFAPYLCIGLVWKLGSAVVGVVIPLCRNLDFFRDYNIIFISRLS